MPRLLAALFARLRSTGPAGATGNGGAARLLAALAVVAVTALATPLVTTRVDAGSAADPAGDDDLLERGRDLYATGCTSCHGTDGQGVEAVEGGAGGPGLTDAGEAGAYFQLSTGRMPAASSDEQPQRKEPAYSPDEIDALVAYVASLGDGPELPDVDLSDADLAAGGLVYRANCQACHSASGSGGALSYGSAAPGLGSSTPAQIGAAVRVGPGQMPTFDTEVISDDELDDLVAYVRYLDNPDDPGGLPIGRTGPIPEGFVAWLVGMVVLVGLVVWIGTRAPLRSAGTGTGTGDGDSGPTGPSPPPSPETVPTAPTAVPETVTTAPTAVTETATVPATGAAMATSSSPETGPAPTAATEAATEATTGEAAEP